MWRGFSAAIPATPDGRSRWAAAGAFIDLILLYTGFLLTGAYATLLGTALPLLARGWGLSDRRSGALFLAQFAGSTAGALLRGVDLSRMVGVGFLLVALSGASLALVSPAAAPLVLFVYGLGLGIAMTSTSVLVSSRAGRRSGSSLASLNAMWALGAGAAPWLLVPYMHSETLHPEMLNGALQRFALPAALMAALLLYRAFRLATPFTPPEQQTPRVPRQTSRRSVLLLGLLCFGSVGAESGLGGWMTTYVSRVGGAPVASLGAASGFWLGLLGSRLLASVLLLGPVTPFSLLAGSLVLAALASLLLLCAGSAQFLLPLAVVCGAAIGPLYPLALSFALRSFRGRWPFVLAGLGAAITPWIVGLITGPIGGLMRGHADPLRAGLLFPLALLVAMAAALFAGRRLLDNA